MNKKAARVGLFISGGIIFASAYQNCAPSKFDSTGSGGVEAATSSTVSTSSASVPALQLPGGTASTTTSIAPVAFPPTSSPALSSTPEAPGVCYDVTCTGDDWTMKTLSGATDAQGLLADLSPNAESTWVVQLGSNHKLAGFLNCTPDANANASDVTGSTLCQSGAASSAERYSQKVSFALGKAKYLRSCQLAPCGFMAAGNLNQTDGTLQWFSAGLSESTGDAVMKIRVVNLANAFTPSRFGVDFTVPKEGCAQQSVSVVTTAAQSVRNFDYEVCMEGKVLTVQTGHDIVTLDLTKLNVFMP